MTSELETIKQQYVKIKQYKAVVILRVLRLMAEGKRHKEIADKLNYSVKTIDSLIPEIRERFGAATDAQLMSIAYKKKLLT